VTDPAPDARHAARVLALDEACPHRCCTGRDGSPCVQCATCGAVVLRRREEADVPLIVDVKEPADEP
jgi:hypothetical protein